MGKVLSISCLSTSDVSDIRQQKKITEKKVPNVEVFGATRDIYKAMVMDMDKAVEDVILTLKATLSSAILWCSLSNGWTVWTFKNIYHHFYENTN